MPDDNTLPTSSPSQGLSEPTAPGPTRPVLTTEEVPTTKATPVQDPNQPTTPTDMPVPSPTIPSDTPPISFPDTSDVPPFPTPDPTDTVASPPSNFQLPTSIPDLPPVVAPTMPGKKFGGKKVIATILGLFLLIGGVAAGVTLIKQQQDIREKAATDCPVGKCRDKMSRHEIRDGECKVFEDPTCRNEVGDVNPGDVPTGQTPKPSCSGRCVTGIKSCTDIGSANISGNCNQGICCSLEGFTGPGAGSGTTGSETMCTTNSCQVSNEDYNKGVYVVHVLCYNAGQKPCNVSNADEVVVTGAKSSSCKSTCGVEQIDFIGGGPPASSAGGSATCSHGKNCEPKKTEVEEEKPKAAPTQTPTTTAQASAQCLNIKAYDTGFNPLTSDQLKALKAGDKVRFAVAGSATSGTFDKARFKVNTTNSGEVTSKKPGTNEFYYEYTVSASDTSITVTAQIHHTTLGWSN